MLSSCYTIGRWPLCRSFFVWIFCWKAASGHLWKFLDDFGGIPEDDSFETCHHNTQALSAALQWNASGNTILIENNRTYHFHHGIYAANVTNFTWIVDGTLRFQRIEHEHDDSWFPAPCFMLDTSSNITITSHTRGLFDGRGSEYWGIPVIGYLEIAERRPRLIQFNQSQHLLIENLILQDSPYHTMLLNGVNHTTVRNVSIVARRTHHDGHEWIDLSAFNTDGIDVSGNDIHIHDVDIWNQDDCIAVKDNFFEPYESTNMVFEHINCSGLGLVVGSISGSRVFNITFRNSYLYKAVKGIYLKFHPTGDFWNDRNRTGSITNVTFSNITMEQPSQWPIWIGPAQQSDSKRPCHANPCSICWPMTPRSVCNPVSNTVFSNLTLRHVQINNPYFSPGVLLGDDSENASMVNVVFDHVRVTKGPPVPAAQMDRLISFPGLAQPINDAYVPNYLDANGDTGNNMHNNNGFSKLFLLGGFNSKQYGYLTYNQDNFNGRWRWNSKLFQFVGAVVAHGGMPIAIATLVIRQCQKSNNYKYIFAVWKMAMVTILYILFVVDVNVPWKKPKWNRTNQYFRCNGVQRGVATGNTWPVPGCFTSMTDDDFLLVDRIRQKILDSQDAILPVEGTISVLILLAIVVGSYHYLDCQDRTDIHKKEQPPIMFVVDHEKGLNESLRLKNHPLPHETTRSDGRQRNIY
jgi:hypothetical protein